MVSQLAGYSAFLLFFLFAVVQILQASKGSSNSQVVDAMKRWSKYVIVQIVCGIAMAFLMDQFKYWQYFVKGDGSPSGVNAMMHSMEILSIMSAYAQIFM